MLDQNMPSVVLFDKCNASGALTAEACVQSHGKATGIVVEGDGKNDGRTGTLEGSAGIHPGIDDWIPLTDQIDKFGRERAEC